MYKLKELPRAIGGYQTDFIEVEPDPQIDEIAKTLEREELQELLQSLVHQFDPFKWRLLIPYCRYGTGKQMNAIAAMIKKWQVWGDFDAAGRRFIIVLHGAMMLSDTREAMFLIEKWGLLDELAKRKNTTAQVLRDTVLTEFDLDANGSKLYDLGNAVIIASLGEDLSIHLFKETDGKDVRSLPKRGADDEIYQAANADLADLKKNIKKAIKNRVDQLKDDFVSGTATKAADWKASYINNYVLKRVASLLVWQWQHEKIIRHFMLTIDGNLIDCNKQTVELPDTSMIRVAHPIEIPKEELECWKELLTEKQIAQPFVQIFEPIYRIELAQAVKYYTGIELPMFLLRGLRKEGLRVDLDSTEPIEIALHGRAVSASASIVNFGTGIWSFNEQSIPFDSIVKLERVHIGGTPRAVNHEIYAMDKALIENRVRNGDIAAIQAFSYGITAKTIQHLIDVSIEVKQMECTAWLMNFKNEHFPYALADLEL